MFLGWTPTEPKGAKFRESFALMLAKQYLNRAHNIKIANGIRDPAAMRFGAVEIPRLITTSGGYREQSSIYGIQTLINFRGGLIRTREQAKPFNIVLASKMSEEGPRPEDFAHKIVIIGSLNYSNVTSFYTATPTTETDLYARVPVRIRAASTRNQSNNQRSSR